LREDRVLLEDLLSVTIGGTYLEHRCTNTTNIRELHFKGESTFVWDKVTKKIELSKMLKDKLRVREDLASKLSHKERRKALKDGHAHREPRPCGLTIHPGRGCSFGCLYCYLEDMGLPVDPEPYGLTGLQLAYAVASNPFTLIGRGGTFLAFGSITEPFLPRIREKTLEYLRVINASLGNPCQLSTKAYLSQEDVIPLSDANRDISALVTIPTLDKAPLIEPFAPSPELRFQTIRNLASAGLHTALFFRPMIPGIADEEGPHILEKAFESGAKGVVLGALRVTSSILKRLQELGFESIESRMIREPRDRRDQVPISMGDVKRMLSKIAERVGLKVYPSACSANVDAHELGCHMCDMGPCGGSLPEYDPEEIEQALSSLGIETKVVPRGHSILVYVRGGSKRRKRAKYLVSTATKRKVLIRQLGNKME